MSEKKKRKAKNRTGQNFIIGFIGILVFIVVGIWIFLFWGASEFSNTKHESFGRETSYTISYFLGTELPSNAVDFYVYSLQWQDIFVDMRFSAPPSELKIWLENNPFCNTLQENTLSNNIPDNYFDVDWWQAEDSLNYTLYSPCGDNPTYIVMIDKRHDDIWVVYIQYTHS